MTASCITFEEIESRAASTLALAIYARRAKEHVLAHTVLLPLVAYLNRDLNKLTIALKTPSVEACNDQQLVELANLLKYIHAFLGKLLLGAEQSNAYRFKAVQRQFKRIDDRREDLESIIENIHLAINPTFHKVVSSALAQLDVRVDENAALLR